ncbi:acyl-homoserine-lactone synthase [Citrobacter amalonaticus]|uniref:Acyl-homoserine-lactone synthase n=1 Tax=Citrobacter amalonaticus TaxID=35703 RepID=A0A2S4RVS7_CITAM|nr:acyl-homoserine-lactone synthase [Citrobacter amalonaticus]POT56327.1 acyl-homoserine-lactone synthase [Citrobacter amalonaticus]POT74852.1 acyl-homoserine-lactone synthase [Citrobacter amalonaticus]POU64381.1 acyl-homoserine-lactone synthase [Citrobacter amalonaticus]POV04217.1 acyl-homoserine-lactone synthase [Citrobacter amalonaticus]
MFNVYVVNFSSLSHGTAEEFYRLRKNIFKDRLQWSVNSSDGKEHDEFDNANANYILGIENGMIICSTRIIDMKHHNMLNDTFSAFFNDVEIPEGHYIESTRFFVDKERANLLPGTRYPVALILFHTLINYAQRHHYDGILAVASHAMMHIIRRSGWNVTVLKKGISEKNEPVYLLLGHTDEASQQALKTRIFSQSDTLDDSLLNDWPLPVNTRSDAE